MTATAMPRPRRPPDRDVPGDVPGPDDPHHPIASPGDGSSAAGDIAPLSSRVRALTACRIAATLVLVWIGVLQGGAPGLRDPRLPVGYLLCTALLGVAVVTIRARGFALGLFGIMIMFDGLAVQSVQHVLGPTLGVDLVLAAFLASVCLLASFRTGIKLAIWQSLLIVMDDRAVTAGLFTRAPDDRPHRVAGELVLLWLLVVVICTAAAVNERELRRRRYDAEALKAFAADLHRDHTPELVLQRSARFLTHELDAARLVICARRGQGLRLLHWAGPVPPGHVGSASGEGSGLLGLALDPMSPAILLRLDVTRDPWLSAVLPGARRLVVLALTGDETDPVWAVFEHRPRAGLRVERRVIATAGQVAAITRLALSRAELFERARAVAVTDGLTGVPNRRAFDDYLAGLSRPSATAGYALLMVDVDHFKSVNDTYGHQAGDDVLRALAATLTATAPPGALVARYGGEEFAVVLPGADGATAAAVGEALRAAVEAGTEPLRVTASFGVALTPAGGAPPAAVIAAADGALYRAKAGGRNQVAFAPPVVAAEGLAGSPSGSTSGLSRAATGGRSS